jgi:glycosyltransferase involved in cell wall biosynthesis
LSLYDTVVCDRKLVSRHHPLAWLLYAWEWLACRAADVVILDTEAHGKYFANTFNLSPEKVQSVLVGAEPGVFAPEESPSPKPSTPLTVLFYGQFIPLHGIETVVRAAGLAGALDIEWVLIGRGQEEDRIRSLLQKVSPRRLTWIEWVPYSELAQWIRRADICLGIFGTSAKAARVIPNKVFQIIATGKPLITRDSPAIRELVTEKMRDIVLVPPGDARALLDAVQTLADAPKREMPLPEYASLTRRIQPGALGSCLAVVLEDVATRHGNDQSVGAL